MIRAATLGMILVLAAAGCSSSEALTVANDGALVGMSVGEEIEVSLEGNITTGFTWELVDFDSAVVAPVGEPTYDEDSGDAVGAGGTWTFTMSAVSEGESLVDFVYHRPFEEEPPAETFSFTVRVKP